MNIIYKGWELKILAFIAIFAAIKFSEPILFPLLLSFFLYLLFNPVVAWLEKIKLPQALASTLIVLLLFILISLAITFLVQPAENLIENAPKNFRLIEQKFQYLKEPIGKIHKVAETAKNITELRQKNEVKVTVSEFSIGTSLFNLTTNILILIFTVLILLFFLLLYFKSFLKNLDVIISRRKKMPKESDFLICLKNEVSKYMFIFSLICFGLGVAVAFSFWLLGFPDPLLWGAMAMFLTYIPYIGHLVGLIIIFVISLISFDSFFYILAAPIIYLLLSALEGQIITPIFLGNRLNLNPLIILLSIFIWSWLWGITGIVISVPFLVMLKITLEHLPDFKKYSLLLEK